MAKIRIQYPVYQQPGRVTFGTGSVRVLAECHDLDQTVFFITGCTKVQQIVQRSLAARAEFAWDTRRVIVKPAGEPTVNMVRGGAECLRAVPCRRVVAIGGGSVMDWCRLAWAESCGLLGGRLEMDRRDPRRPEIWLIPTTCATGAEAAHVAVYLAGEKKVAVAAPAFLADHVILDGQFLAHLESGGLENSLTDAVSHAIEAFVSLVPNYLAKEAAASALRIILEQYSAPETPSRNERLMEAGYLGGLAAAHCSVGVVHAFAHSVASYGVRHGHANALGLVAGLKANRGAAAMDMLLTRCRSGSLGELVERFEPWLRMAIRHGEHDSLRVQLQDRSARETICQRMLDDVCLRSNPKALTRNDLDTFLDNVLEAMRAA